MLFRSPLPPPPPIPPPPPPPRNPTPRPAAAPAYTHATYAHRPRQQQARMHSASITSVHTLQPCRVYDTDTVRTVTYPDRHRPGLLCPPALTPEPGPHSRTPTRRLVVPSAPPAASCIKRRPVNQSGPSSFKLSRASSLYRQLRGRAASAPRILCASVPPRCRAAFVSAGSWLPRSPARPAPGPSLSVRVSSCPCRLSTPLPPI